MEWIEQIQIVIHARFDLHNHTQNMKRCEYSWNYQLQNLLVYMLPLLQETNEVPEHSGWFICAIWSISPDFNELQICAILSCEKELVRHWSDLCKSKQILESTACNDASELIKSKVNAIQTTKSRDKGHNVWDCTTVHRRTVKSHCVCTKYYSKLFRFTWITSHVHLICITSIWVVQSRGNILA